MTPEQRHEIIHRFHSGQSMRGIGKDLQLSPQTVSRALRQHAADRREGPLSADSPVRPESRSSKLDAHDTKIQNLLERYPKITAKRIMEEIQADGYAGGYSILSERIARLRPRDGKPFTERFETGPGVQAQMDYALYTLDFTSEGRRRVNLFSYILGYSRRQYLRFVESQDLAMTLREHVRAFEHLGGAAATCLYDNMKVVVDRWEDDQPIYNRRFLAFAMHYGFRPVACRPRRPQTKGKVERPFDYVEKSLLAGREFRSLEHLNEVTQWWLAEKADVRTHATTGERPIDRHAEERSSLLALPESAYEVHEVVYRVVDAEGFVACDGNRYSVPWKKTHPGEVLAVKITDTEVIIYGRDYCEIARHGLFLKTARGAVREDPAHGPPRETRLRRDVLQARFAEFGDVATRFLDGLWQAQRQAPSQAALILELSGLYRRPDFIAALERAVRFGAYSLSSVRRILEINARPKSALESLLDSPGEPLTSLSDISSPPRATSAYQSLLFPEPDDERPTQDEKASTEETSTPGVEITEGSAATTGPKDDECASADNCQRADEDPKTGEDTDSSATA
ncbi:MAG: IS21 family transposase [Planctomycetota bacterium]|nr:IS21 family transposase [Planctomycetota bacterium]